MKTIIISLECQLKWTFGNCRLYYLTDLCKIHSFKIIKKYYLFCETYLMMKNFIPEIERPFFLNKEVSCFLKENYDLNCVFEELPGERDRNYLVREKRGELFVLKISNSSEALDFMNVQNDALERVSKVIEKGRIPEVCPNINGELLSSVMSSNGTPHLMRLVRYVEGLPMAEYKPHTKEFFVEAGRMCGTVTDALKNISSTPPTRKLLWEIHDVNNTLNEYIPCIKDNELQKCVRQSLSNFCKSPSLQGKKLRRCWIHNDFNDYNILVVPNLIDSPKFGLIDFGDMTHSYLVADPAIACAYAMLEKSDPLDAAFHFIRGYHSCLPLEEIEIEILFPMILMRLCLSVTIGAFQQQKDPENKYLGISQKSARELLIELQNVNHTYAHYLMRDACKMEACTKALEFSKWQKKANGSFRQILGETYDAKKTLVLDLSVGSSFSSMTANMSIEEQQEYFSKHLKSNQAELGFGRYGEVRSVYTSKEFLKKSLDGEERRTIHLGVDLFKSVGTLIYAPIEGEVFFLRDNKSALDYGPTVILKHKPYNGPDFFTLYGHLARECLENLYSQEPDFTKYQFCI